MVTVLPARRLAGKAVTRPDAGRLARGGEHRRDSGAGSPEAALESGHLRHMFPAGHLRVRVEPAEYAEHRTQMRVCPAQASFDAVKLTSLTVVEAHLMLFSDAAAGRRG